MQPGFSLFRNLFKQLCTLCQLLLRKNAILGFKEIILRGKMSVTGIFEGKSCQIRKSRSWHDRRQRKSHAKRGKAGRGMTAAKEKVMPNEEKQVVA